MSVPTVTPTQIDALRAAALQLGFGALTIAPLQLSGAAAGLNAWLMQGHHGSMDYMKRWPRDQTEHLLPHAKNALIVTLPYLTASSESDEWRRIAWQQLNHAQQPYVSLYARGRDYHKIIRQRLKQLIQGWQESTQLDFDYRIVTDSAPLMEVELAHRAGLGRRGKHTLLLRQEGGSLFFLAEILTTLELPFDQPTEAAQCGQCTRCLDICPTQAIIAPYQLDARRCISYLTIEHKGPIDIELRPLIGNRLYGCDDCQLICPWNKFAQTTPITDFMPRAFASADLITLLSWQATDFQQQTQGTSVHRIGFESWLRNLFIVAGNALAHQDNLDLRQALAAWQGATSDWLQAQLAWSLQTTPLQSAASVSRIQPLVPIEKLS